MYPSMHISHITHHGTPVYVYASPTVVFAVVMFATGMHTYMHSLTIVTVTRVGTQPSLQPRKRKKQVDLPLLEF